MENMMIEMNNRKNNKIGSQRMNTNIMITNGRIEMIAFTTRERWMDRHLK